MDVSLKSRQGTAEMAQQGGGWAVQPLVTSFGGSDAAFWTLGTWHSQVHVSTHRLTHTYIIKNETTWLFLYFIYFFQDLFMCFMYMSTLFACISA